MVELAFDRVQGARPERAIAFLHGILGSGGNLRSLARRFVEARPTFAAWLVDLRGHGASPRASPGASVAAAARDVVELTVRASEPLAALVGHSFGGKVALEAARAPISSLAHVVTIDSVPGAREPLRGGDSALAVLDALEALPGPFPSRRAFVEAVMAGGRGRALAEWLAQSLGPAPAGGYRFSLDPEEMRALVLDYFARDLWDVVERPPGEVRVHLVIGERSSAYSPADRERAARLAAAGDRVTVDTLPTDHWVHVEDPDGLLRVMLERIPG